MEAVTAEGELGSGTLDEAPGADLSRNPGLPPVRAAVTVALVGLVITLAVSGAAWTLNRHNEHRLLEVQTRQAVAVLSEAIQISRARLTPPSRSRPPLGAAPGSSTSLPPPTWDRGIPSYRPCSSGRTEPPGSRRS